MKASVDQNGCIGCGLCESICPDVFRMSAAGTAEVHVDTVPASAGSAAKEAAENCPVAVITVE